MSSSPSTDPRGAPSFGLFASLTFDDPIFGNSGFGLVDSWRAAGRPADVHVYQAGGYGYGMGRAGTTTTS